MENEDVPIESHHENLVKSDKSWMSLTFNPWLIAIVLNSFVLTNYFLGITHLTSIGLALFSFSLVFFVFLYLESTGFFNDSVSVATKTYAGAKAEKAISSVGGAVGIATGKVLGFTIVGLLAIGILFVLYLFIGWVFSLSLTTILLILILLKM